MPEKPLVILASARKLSDTERFLERAFAGLDYQLMDLLDYRVLPYEYAHNYPGTDEFLKIVDALIQHKVIVFATPVYWYAMSGLMKNFMDRFTDLITVEKQRGRQLRGKKTFLLAVGADKELPEGFEIPFRLTSEYFKMTYLGAIYYAANATNTGDEWQEHIKSFVQQIEWQLH